jgi:membrane-bound lytic murein transglycosylase D
MKARTRHPRFACSLLLACALPLAATAQPDVNSPEDADPLLSISTAHGDRQLADLSARLLPGLASPAGSATRGAAGFDAWAALRKGTSFAAEPHRRPAVDASLRHYRKHSYALAHSVRQAALYLPYVTRRLVESDLPPELALLPFVESAYDPLALSPSGAAGLWQITKATADRLGLKRNQWYDGRNDIVRSTDAAITYLHYLNHRFGGDWLLTLAAYNGGEGRVARAIMANLASGRETDFWALDLPPETRTYVPRFLALASLFRDTEALSRLRPQALSPPRSLETLVLPGQISLVRAAQLADIDYELLKRLNAGLKRDVTPPQGPHRLVLPRRAARRFVAAVTFAREPIWDPASLELRAPPAQAL